jgi:hypothetical protein
MYGWIKPNKEFLECDKWDHLQSIFDDVDTFSVGTIEDMSITLDRIEDSCRELIEQDEHPEWHRYEMYKWDVEYEARKQLLEAGFIRVGQHKDRIHFEGSQKAITDKMQFLKDFAEDRNCTAEFEIQEIK